MQDVKNKTIELENLSKHINGERSIDVQIYDDFESLSGLQPAWDRFMEEMEAEIFLTYDWCRIWWKYYGKERELKVFVFRQNENIVGILPLFFETIGLWPVNIDVVKIVGTDFLPITINISLIAERLNEIIQILLSKLNQLYKYDIIYLGQLCGKCEVVDQIEKAFKDVLPLSYNVSQRTRDVQTYFQLTNSWDEQVASLSPRQRTKTRKVYKVIQEKGISLTSAFATESNLVELFDDFVKMHQSQWQQIGISGHFIDWPSAYEFHKEVVQVQRAQDRARLLQIRLDDKVIGYDYLFKFGQTYHWFLSARSTEDLDSRLDFHRISFGEKVKKALNDGVTMIDGGRGKYEYKIVMGGEITPVRDIYIYPHSPISFIKVSLLRRFIWIITICYVKIWRRRIAPRLGIKTGTFWRWWLRTSMLSI